MTQPTIITDRFSLASKDKPAIATFYFKNSPIRVVNVVYGKNAVVISTELMDGPLSSDFLPFNQYPELADLYDQITGWNIEEARKVVYDLDDAYIPDDVDIA